MVASTLVRLSARVGGIAALAVGLGVTVVPGGGASAASARVSAPAKEKYVEAVDAQGRGSGCSAALSPLVVKVTTGSPDGVAVLFPVTEGCLVAPADYTIETVLLERLADGSTRRVGRTVANQFPGPGMLTTHSVLNRFPCAVPGTTHQLVGRVIVSAGPAPDDPRHFTGSVSQRASVTCRSAPTGG
jgi:hypothetical protein